MTVNTGGEQNDEHTICEMLPGLRTRLTLVMLRGGYQQHPLTSREPKSNRHANGDTRDGEASGRGGNAAAYRAERRRCSRSS